MPRRKSPFRICQPQTGQFGVISTPSLEQAHGGSSIVPPPIPSYPCCTTSTGRPSSGRATVEGSPQEPHGPQPLIWMCHCPQLQAAVAHGHAPRHTSRCCRHTVPRDGSPRARHGCRLIAGIPESSHARVAGWAQKRPPDIGKHPEFAVLYCDVTYERGLRLGPAITKLAGWAGGTAAERGCDFIPNTAPTTAAPAPDTYAHPAPSVYRLLVVDAP